jgi:hypothetical protein
MLDSFDPRSVNKQETKSILTSCVAPDGCRMSPFPIVKRITADKELSHIRCSAWNVVVMSQGKEFMTSMLFET